MVQCKTVFYAIGVIFLLFFGIPIRIKTPLNSDNLENETVLFEQYIRNYNKSYKHNKVLRLHKFKAFKDSLKEIDLLNSQRDHNQSAYFGVTKFSDLSKDSFIDKYLQSDMYSRMKNNSYYVNVNVSSNERIHSDEISKRSLNTYPLKVDWRDKGVVTKVNNQKNCGACWAFSVVETIESMQCIKKGRLYSLSVQELIDCAGYTNAGCDGGDICALLFWLYDNDIRIQKEIEYPLRLVTDTCKLTKNNFDGVQIADFSCKSYVDSEERLLDLIANHGPVAVAVNAALWQNYLGGVIRYHCDSKPLLLNHAVQIVGYDLSADIPFYIVRNSWGADFGDNGYLYIAIGNNVCGLVHEVVSLEVL